MEKQNSKNIQELKEKYGKVMTAYLNKKDKGHTLTSPQKVEFYKLAMTKLADLPADKRDKYDILFALDWAFHEMLEKQKISNQIEKASKGIRLRIDTNIDNVL